MLLMENFEQELMVPTIMMVSYPGNYVLGCDDFAIILTFGNSGNNLGVQLLKNAGGARSVV